MPIRGTSFSARLRERNALPVKTSRLLRETFAETEKESRGQHDEILSEMLIIRDMFVFAGHVQ